LFGASKPDDTDAYLVSRFRLSADLHITPYLRLFAEGKASFALDRTLEGGRTSSFVDEFDLQNGFADIRIPLGERADVTLRGGRQELMFGAQRLVGVSDFTNVRRTFDGGQGIIRIGDWTISPFWAELVVVDKYKFNESTPDNKLFGIYSTGPLRLLPGSLDLYWFDADNAGVTTNGTSGRERRHTLGTRTWGKIGQTNLDFEIEGAGQFGSVGRRDIAAGMFTAVLGYTLPTEHLTLSLQQYFFWRASDHDALYNKSGQVFRPGTGTTASYVGAEIDLLATYNLTPHMLGYVGYSRFFTGDFIRKTGPAKDSDFFYGAMQYTF
jgi:hypothetical protein